MGLSESETSILSSSLRTWFDFEKPFVMKYSRKNIVQLFSFLLIWFVFLIVVGSIIVGNEYSEVMVVVSLLIPFYAAVIATPSEAEENDVSFWGAANFFAGFLVGVIFVTIGLFYVPVSDMWRTPVLNLGVEILSTVFTGLGITKIK